MTIAIGYRCYGGVIVAADTLTTIGQEAHEGTKLTAFWTQAGAFAFVDSSDDANATQSLSLEVKREIENQTPESYEDLGKIIKSVMTEWRRGFGARKPPSSALIVGAKIRTDCDMGLFLCEPPNTFRPVSDYVAMGAGASVTDFLHNYLFSHLSGEYIDVQAVLRRIAYMLYRAKKDTIVCGKRSHAAVISTHTALPVLVDMDALAHAETMSANLDTLLSAVAEFALDSTSETVKSKLADLMAMLESSEVRSTRFRDDRYGEEITTWIKGK